MMVFVVVFSVALAFSCALAMAIGERDEKIAAIAYATASLVSAYVVSPLAVRFSGLEWSVMAVDVALLVPFLIIVIRSTRIWPLWACAFQVVSIVANSVILSPASPYAYAATLYLMSYGILAAIVTGSVFSFRNRRIKHSAATERST